MATTAFSKFGFVTVVHFQLQDALEFRWDDLSLSLEETKQMHNQMKDYARTHGVKTLIANTQNAKLGSDLAPGVKEFSLGPMANLYCSVGTKNLIFLVAPTAATRARDSKFINYPGSFSVVTVDTIGKALTLAGEIKKNSK